MMTVDQLKQASSLAKEIEANERLLAAYTMADVVTVGIPATAANQMRHTSHELELTRVEIAGPIVAAIERRIAEKRDALRQLGVA
jgi:hypothetical protein